MIDTVKEAETLEHHLATGKSSRRQYVFRLDVGPAALLTRRCINEGKQPGPLIEEIIVDVFSTWAEGVHMKFPAIQLQVLDKIALLKGMSREDVVRQLVTENLPGLLTAVMEREKEMQKALATATPKTPGTRVGK